MAMMCVPVFLYIYIEMAVNLNGAYRINLIPPSVSNILQYVSRAKNKMFPSNCCSQLTEVSNGQKESQLVHVSGHLAASLTQFEGSLGGIDTYLYGCLLYNEAALKLMVQSKRVHV